MRLLKRRMLWITALLLAVAAGAWFFVPRSRINQANFDRIQEGMTGPEVAAIFGEPGKFGEIIGEQSVFEREWEDGLNRITVQFEHGKMRYKGIELATPWETFVWYAKKGAAKIGLNWDEPDQPFTRFPERSGQ